MLLMTIMMLFFITIVLMAVVIAHHTRIKQLLAERQVYESKMAELEQEMKALMSADIVFGKSVKELNTQLIALDNRQEVLENQRNNDNGYRHALKILEMGGSKEEIMENCHVSQAEAELLANINAYRAVNNTSSTNENT